MFISKISDFSKIQAWNFQVRQAYDAVKSDYIYIRQPCSWTQRLLSVALSALLLVGAVFSERYRMGLKELLQVAYQGYGLEIAAKGGELFPYEAFKRFLDQDINADELESVLLRSSDISLRLMALLGPGLLAECPLLDAYLNKVAKTPGQKLSFFLRLVEAASLQGWNCSKPTPEIIESFLCFFNEAREHLSVSGWQLRSMDETGKMIACMDCHEFSDSIDVCDQLNSYRRLIYMQGSLELSLQNCERVPDVFSQMQNLKTVVVQDSSHCPRGLSRLLYMRHLKFINCEIKDCAEDLRPCTRLKALSFSSHQADEVPAALCMHPEINTLEIQGAIITVPMPGPKVENFWVQPNSRGALLPNLTQCTALKWFHWPLALRGDLGPFRFPSSCRLGYL